MQAPDLTPTRSQTRQPGWRLTSTLIAAVLAASCAVAPTLVGSNPAPVMAAAKGARRHDHRRDDERPKAHYALKSTRFPLTVHWQGDDRRPRAAALLHYVEAAWQREVVELGWAAPLPDGGKGGDDNLDLYLVPIGDGQAYVAEEKRLTRPYAVASSYVAFDDGLKDDGTLESYAFHEFNHVCQYAMDANEGDAFYENSASFMDRFLKPNGPASKTGIADFQAEPERSLDYIGDQGEYEYGAGLFLQFLVERYGNGRPDLVRKIWEAGRQPAVGGGDPNEPDWIDVLPAVLRAENGPDVETALTAFEAWRLQASFTKPARLPRPAMIVSGGHPSQVQPEADLRPAPWGANFIRLETRGAKTLTAKLSASGTARWRLWLGVQAADGSWTAMQSPSSSQQPSVSLPLGAAASVYAVVVNLGNGQHDPDRKDWNGNAYRLNLDWER